MQLSHNDDFTSHYDVMYISPWCGDNFSNGVFLFLPTNIFVFLVLPKSFASSFYLYLLIKLNSINMKIIKNTCKYL